ncbi:hypothetical protein GCM10007916_28780 [Psychromonas marina]|uniref:DUF1566 domain-containing protein n=1 Tax=Psychromonas marina TaxID=88364 RepID=A0ABQ6E3M0_9GAMM|nr:hypothetical protein [Psychromonas marina]GLS91808.1 hypothetical protein GCM10007916_28780 [Psychromonas marina]
MKFKYTVLNLSMSLFSFSLLAAPSGSIGNSPNEGGNQDKAYIDGFPFTYCRSNTAKISTDDCTFVSVPDNTDIEDLGKMTYQDVTNAIDPGINEFSDIVASLQGVQGWSIPAPNQMEYLKSNGYLRQTLDNKVATYVVLNEGDYYEYTIDGGLSDKVSASAFYLPAYIRNGGLVPPPIDEETPNLGVCPTGVTLAGNCLDIFDAGSGKLFTNSPSVTYVDQNLSVRPTNTVLEEGTFGPLGRFYLFSQKLANQMCDEYSSKGLGGRSNWKLATKDDYYEDLAGKFGNMFKARGWPVHEDYMSSTFEHQGGDPFAFFVLLSTHSLPTTSNLFDVEYWYASCVSES